MVDTLYKYFYLSSYQLAEDMLPFKNIMMIELSWHPVYILKYLIEKVGTTPCNGYVFCWHSVAITKVVL